MASTGEVANIAENYLEAFFASWLSTDQAIRGKRLLVSAGSDHRLKLADPLKQLEEQGWDLYATEGTHDFLAKRGIGSISVYKVSEKVEPNIATLIAQRKFDLIINIPKTTSTRNTEGFKIRRLAIDHHIPLITNGKLAQVFLQCLAELNPKDLSVPSLSELYEL